MSRLSNKYRNFTRLLMSWLRNRMPEVAPKDFPITSISVNSSYAAKRHRDKANEGPSLIRAFGNFTGGDLRYWPKDSGRGSVKKLHLKDATVLRVKKETAMFDGRRAHEVTPFQGKERFSLVFFTVGKYYNATPAERNLCKEIGLHYPSSADALKRATALT